MQQKFGASFFFQIHHFIIDVIKLNLKKNDEILGIQGKWIVIILLQVLKLAQQNYCVYYL